MRETPVNACSNTVKIARNSSPPIETETATGKVNHIEKNATRAYGFAAQFARNLGVKQEDRLSH